jgi:hypothetical protein
MFNYKNLALAQAKQAGAEAALALAKELYERLIADGKAEIARLREANDNMRGKISLLETIVMPLSSKAGAQYQAVLHPAEKQLHKPYIEPKAGEWQRFKAAKEAELEKEYLIEDTNAQSLSPQESRSSQN